MTGYPRRSLVVNIPPSALRRVALSGTPLPQGRMGKAGWAKRHSVTLRAECQWPGGPTGTRSSRLGWDSAVWSGRGMDKRCTLSTHQVAYCTLFFSSAPTSVDMAVGTRISLTLSMQTHKPPSSAPALPLGPARSPLPQALVGAGAPAQAGLPKPPGSPGPAE